MRVDPRLTPCWFRQLRHLIDRTGGADLAAEMLGQAPVEITKQHFVEPDERESVTAEILQALAAAAEGAKTSKA